MKLKISFAVIASSFITLSTVSAETGIPDQVISNIEQTCNESFAQNTYRDMSAENCMAEAVETYKKSHPAVN